LDGKLDEGIFVRQNLAIDLARFLSLPSTEIQTLVRKNEGIQFSVTDDTFVEEPILTIHFRRRLPDRN